MDISANSQSSFLDKSFEASNPNRFGSDFVDEDHKTIFYQNLELLKVKYRKIVREELMKRYAETSGDFLAAENCLKQYCIFSK